MHYVGLVAIVAVIQFIAFGALTGRARARALWRFRCVAPNR